MQLYTYSPHSTKIAISMLHRLMSLLFPRLECVLATHSYILSLVHSITKVRISSPEVHYKVWLLMSGKQANNVVADQRLMDECSIRTHRTDTPVPHTWRCEFKRIPEFRPTQTVEQSGSCGRNYATTTPTSTNRYLEAFQANQYGLLC